MKKYATIIGSRNITKTEFQTLKEIAEFLHNKDFILRSGGADGADSSIMHLKNIEVFIPWKGFNKITNGIVLNQRNLNIAKKAIKVIHPAYDKLSHGALKLHCRNVQQVWGEDLEDPTATSIVVFCADEDIFNNVSGGTRTAVEIARRKKIPVYNIRQNSEKSVSEMIEDIQGILF